MLKSHQQCKDLAKQQIQWIKFLYKLKNVEQRQNTHKHQNRHKVELNTNTKQLEQMNLVEYIVIIVFRC